MTVRFTLKKGRLLFADPTVNETTGQITLRAAIPNDRNILMPGLYVRVLMEQVAVDNAFVVPQQAVTRRFARYGDGW